MNLTENDCMELTGAFTRWWYIREQAGMSPRGPADVTKSCLLTRLLTGKEPLPDPPPTNHSAPWYELIENGHATLDAVFVRPITQGERAGRWSICQCGDWFPVGEDDEGCTILSRVHRWTGEPMAERWHIKATSYEPRSTTAGLVRAAWTLTRLPDA